MDEAATQKKQKEEAAASKWSQWWEVQSKREQDNDEAWMRYHVAEKQKWQQEWTRKRQQDDLTDLDHFLEPGNKSSRYSQSKHSWE